MNFDEFDKKMRIYEQSLDQVILPEMYLAARLDGRGFTRLTKEVCKFEAPFDVRSRRRRTPSEGRQGNSIPHWQERQAPPSP